MKTLLWMTIITYCAYNTRRVKTGPSGRCKPCHCYHHNHDFITDCSNRGLENIPNQIPKITTQLLLNGNKIYILRNDSFEHVPHLRHLNISNSYVYDTEPMTFSPLHYIHTIDISYNPDLSFDNFSKATYGLQNSTTLQILKLDAIYPLTGTYIPIKVDSLKLLKRTSLKELHISKNGLTHYQTGFIRNLPSTLETFVASWNRFFYGSYLLELLLAESLRYLDISHMNGILYELTSHNSSLIHVPLPRNLEVLVFSHSCLKMDFRSELVSQHKLKQIDLSNNYIIALQGPLYGLEKVEVWDLSNNIITQAEASFFSVTNNNSLKILNISNNFLGQCIGRKCDTMFRNMSNLQFLDISGNKLDILPPELFIGNAILEMINMSNNNLRALAVQMKHMKNLLTLDLSNNQLQAVPQSTLEEFNMMSNLSIRFKGNPLACVCENLNFIEWMKNHQNKIIDMESLNCRLTNGSYIGLTDIDTIVRNLQSECSGSKILIISLTLCGVVLLLGVLGASMGFKYRWKIRYFYYIGRKRYAQLATRDEDEIEYLYDAFVSYADTDRFYVRQSMIPELEEKAGLKLCIHHRDFLPGEVISSNIVNAIQNSRKTLIVLSPSFLKSEWCEFEYHMARLEGVTRRQNIVLVVLYEPVNMKDLPKDMAALLSTNCYLEYNINEYGSVIFWQKLVESISSINVID